MKSFLVDTIFFDDDNGGGFGIDQASVQHINDAINTSIIHIFDIVKKRRKMILNLV